MAKKGSLVRIERILLPLEQRPDNLPEDTKKTPYKMWVKGFLITDDDLPGEVEIATFTNRREKGELKEINPRYTHSFGGFVSELITLRDIIKDDFYA